MKQYYIHLLKKCESGRIDHGNEKETLIINLPPMIFIR